MAYVSRRARHEAELSEAGDVSDVAGGPPTRTNGRVRRPTATSRFGVSRREAHDASEFYGRFPKPELSDDKTVNPPTARDRIWVGDARTMDGVGDIADDSVALVVTSPPYFAGKEYETAVGEGHVPESYIAYLGMLRGVFAECLRKLEPGGRIAVNVANLGRKPYRSLSADVIDLLQGLGFLLRGEILWIKGKAAGGSCAWGSFQRPGNPVFRDLSERIIVASKGRFDRAVPPRDRAGARLPSAATISADEFMDLTTDVWELPPERATVVGHPAPFPIELPRRLIDLYTYEGDLVLDPFMGSGSTAVAAVRTGRHYVGFDTDPAYVEQALARLAHEHPPLDSALAPAASTGVVDHAPSGLDAVHGSGAPSDGPLVIDGDPAPVAALPGPGAVASGVGTGGSRVADGEPPLVAAVPVAGVVGSGGRSAGSSVVGGRASSAGVVLAGARLVRVLADGDRPSGRRGAAGRASAGVAIEASADAEVPTTSAGHLGLGPEVEAALRAGRKAKDVAALMLAEAGFEQIESARTLKVAGLPIDLRARDRSGRVWIFDVTAGFSAGNPGLRRTETFWRALGKASGLVALVPDLRYVLFTVDLPLPSTPPARALAAVQGTGEGKTITDVIRLLDADDVARLRTHAGRDG
jgi:site-specific DNA-methyltransferase (adenine-specific)